MRPLKEKRASGFARGSTGVRGACEDPAPSVAAAVPRSKSGFTLIEIIITIVVVSIALFGLLGGVSFVTRKQLNAEVMTTATFLAQEKMEWLIAEKRANGYSDPDLNIGTTSETLTGAYANYTRSVEICNVDSSFGSPDCTAPDNGSGYKRITVEVNYTGSLQDLPTDDLVKLVSVVANY